MPAAAELAVYAVAAQQGADAAALLDSRDLMRRVTDLGPDTPGFVGRVTEMVRETVQTNAGYRLAAEQPPAPAEVQPSGEQAPGAPLSRNEQLAHKATRRAALTPDYAGEITAQDVQDADPRVVGQWATSGKLAHLGIPAQKTRGRR